MAGSQIRHNSSRINPQNILLAFIGCVLGAALQLHWFSGAHSGWDPFKESLYEFAVNGGWKRTQMNLRLSLTPILAVIILFLLRGGVRKLLSKFEWYHQIETQYKKYDTLTYLPLVLTLTEIWGFYVVPVVYFLLFIFLNFFLIYRLLNKKQISLASYFQGIGNVGVLFFISGFAALIYQVIWQRLLFAAYGVNIESITIIVSVFILGLGIGAILGGWFSSWFPNRLPLLFLICEFSIGAFGFLSHAVIDRAAGLSGHLSIFELSAVIFSLLLIPTIFMGATLPILVEYLTRHKKSVGKSVSILYFLNTAGSALASFATVNILLVYFDLTSTLYMAASLNVIVGAALYSLIVKRKEAAPDHSAAPNENPMKEDQKVAEAQSR